MHKTKRILMLGATLVVAAGATYVGVEGRKHNEEADRQRCASQLICLGQAILLYCNENRGNLPRSWKEIYEQEGVSSEAFVCPASRDTPAFRSGDGVDTTGQLLLSGGHCSYQYIGGGNIRDLTPDIVLAAEHPSHHGGNLEVNVLFSDGQVRHMTGAASKQILNDIASGLRPVRYSGNEGLVMR